MLEDIYPPDSVWPLAHEGHLGWLAGLVCGLVLLAGAWRWGVVRLRAAKRSDVRHDVLDELQRLRRHHTTLDQQHFMDVLWRCVSSGLRGYATASGGDVMKNCPHYTLEEWLSWTQQVDQQELRTAAARLMGCLDLWQAARFGGCALDGAAREELAVACENFAKALQEIPCITAPTSCAQAACAQHPGAQRGGCSVSLGL